MELHNTREAQLILGTACGPEELEKCVISRSQMCQKKVTPFIYFVQLEQWHFHCSVHLWNNNSIHKTKEEIVLLQHVEPHYFVKQEQLQGKG